MFDRPVTTSEIRTFRRCQREHQIAYVLGIRLRKIDLPLRFGQIVHQALEVWWRDDKNLVGAIDVTGAADIDPFERAKARALIEGYHHRWASQEFECVAVEASFRLPRDGYVLAGKLDAVARTPDGRMWLVEHKTSGSDISAGSCYWQKLTLDDQVSNYYSGARALGFEVDACVYDVIGKPSTKPLRATPVEKRKRTKAGKLYKGHRETDETPGDYLNRLRLEIAEKPNTFYQRANIVRLEREEERARRDALRTVQDMSRTNAYEPAVCNPDACLRFGRFCGYHPVCTGETTLEDERFRKLTHVHEELQTEKEERK